jgi:tRNA U38,U39,U40 pseudouridine synthase TruA
MLKSKTKNTSKSTQKQSKKALSTQNSQNPHNPHNSDSTSETSSDLRFGLNRLHLQSRTFKSTTPSNYNKKYEKNKKKNKKASFSEQPTFSASHSDNEDSIPTTPPKTQRPRDYIDVRDQPGYKERMADKTKGNVYDDPTLFSVKYSTLAGKSYSDEFRPDWVTNLDQSLNNNPANIQDPNLVFPSFQSTNGVQHQGLKVPMDFSSEIQGEFLPNANIRIKPTKNPKPNVALMVSYRGTGYKGLQIQFQGEDILSLNTIEGELLNAIFKTGYINSQQKLNPYKAKWSRAARTDKGVHAATNLLNVKLRIPYSQQIPEVMFVEKKAQKYASQRFFAIVPKLTEMLKDLINQGSIDIIEDDNETGNKPTTSEGIPINILTTKRSELNNLLNNDTIGVDLLGNVTFSPSLIHTLKKFKIFDQNDENSVESFINKSIEKIKETDTIPTHAFTEWERKLLHLVGQFGKEWENDQGDNDDDEDGENKKEIPAAFIDEDKNLREQGFTDEQIKDLSKRQRSLFANGAPDAPDSARRKNQDKIPYVRQQGWQDEDIAYMFNADFFSDCIQTRLRTHLPKQLHVVRGVKVTSSFDAKLQASSRTYEYIIPSFAFMSIAEYPEGLHDKMLSVAKRDTFQHVIDENMGIKKPNNFDRQAEDETKTGDKNQNGKRNRPKKSKEEEEEDEGDDNGQNDDNVDDVLANKGPDAFSADDLVPPDPVLNYRITPQKLVDIQFALSHFLGTRSHHNFTSGKKPSDPASKRFIRSFKPIGVFTVNNIEFIHFCVHGDSFLLHQIRKMMGFSMSLIRGNYNDVSLDANRPCEPDERYIQPCTAANSIISNKQGVSDVITSETVPKPSQSVVDVCKHAFGHVFSNDRYNIPPAPALGLLLDHVHYDSHDFRTARLINPAVKAGNWSHIRETLYASYQRLIPFVLQIKSKEIYPEIAIQELTTSNAWRWLHLLNLLDFKGAKLDSNGIPLFQQKVNKDLIKANKLSNIAIDVHNRQLDGDTRGGLFQSDVSGNKQLFDYVKLDQGNTASIPVFEQDKKMDQNL